MGNDEAPSLPESANSTGQLLGTTSTEKPRISGTEIVPIASFDLVSSLQGMSASAERIVFTQTTMPLLVAAVGMAKEAADSAKDEAHELREENRELQAQVSDLREQLAGTRSDLRGERASSALRVVIGSFGSALLGLLPFVEEKSSTPGAIICAILGVAMVAAPWVHMRMYKPPKNSDGTAS